MASARLWNWYRISGCAFAVFTCEGFLMCVSWRVSVQANWDRRCAVAIYQLNRIAVFRRTTELTPVPAKKSHKSRGASPAGKK
jgi:hypothetical protein